MTTRKRPNPRVAREELTWLEQQLNGPLINLDLIDIVKSAEDVQKGRAKGGEKAAKARTEKWHHNCINEAKKLLADNRDPHTIAGILAKRYGRDAGTIRRVLKNAGMR